MGNYYDEILNGLNPLGSVIIHKRTPWVTAWWSAAFPGFGYIHLCQNVKGMIFIGWEFFINLSSHINEAIYYTFSGRFEQAKSILDKRWALLYVGIYVFAIADGYRLTVEYNKMTRIRLNNRNNPGKFAFSSNAINIQDKRIPWLSLAWSVIFPGLGHIYLHKILAGMFFILCMVIICYLSNILNALQFTFIGEFQKATAVIHPKWLLFFPSIYGFAIYDSYVSALEQNKLFDREQTEFLKNNYQNEEFKLPL